MKTGGWADYANGRNGLAYTNHDFPIIIDDATYPNPLEKRKAFEQALKPHTPKFVIISGDIDLSDGKLYDNSRGDPIGATNVGSRVVDVGSNTTLIGMNDARLKFGGLWVQGDVSNPVHMYNNLFRDVTTYAFGPGRNAHFIVQNNLFVAPIASNNRVINWSYDTAEFPLVLWSEDNAGYGDTRLVNNFINAGGSVWFDRNNGAPLGRTKPTVRPWIPEDFYDYTLTDDVQGLCTLLPKQAGSNMITLVDFQSSLRE